MKAVSAGGLPPYLQNSLLCAARIKKGFSLLVGFVVHEHPGLVKKLQQGYRLPWSALRSEYVARKLNADPVSNVER